MCKPIKVKDKMFEEVKQIESKHKKSYENLHEIESSRERKSSMRDNNVYQDKMIQSEKKNYKGSGSKINLVSEKDNSVAKNNDQSVESNHSQKGFNNTSPKSNQSEHEEFESI